jgi:hypothetical protein
MEYPNNPNDVVNEMTGKFSTKQAREIGDEMGVSWDKYDIEEFRMGLEVETEHQDITKGDSVMTGKIALAHLKELPDYYTKLKKMESEAE